MDYWSDSRKKAFSELRDVMKELKIEATIENLAKVFAFLSESMESYECDPKIKRQIKLCVEELFVNIAHYAYNPDIGVAEISIDTVPGSDGKPKMVISFADSGKPYDPLSLPDPDIEADLEDRKIGGLGVYLVRTTMDNFEYKHKDGQNITTIEKKLKGTD